jgi:hypothetical protein
MMIIHTISHRGLRGRDWWRGGSLRNGFISGSVNVFYHSREAATKLIAHIFYVTAVRTTARKVGEKK